MRERDPYGPIDGELTDSAGRRFRDVRATLTPSYRVAWLQIGLGHFALAAAVLLAAQAESTQEHAVAAVLSGLAVGYAMAYVQLFLHEGAHYLLASNRQTNDMLTNLFVGVWIGQDIRKYRPIHFGHHRDIGTVEDTERTYFEALTLAFIVKSLTGIRVVEVLRHRRQALATVDTKVPASSPSKVTPSSRWPLIVGVLLHGLILASLVWSESWGAALGWVAGIGLYPFLTSLRQLLEHRALVSEGQVPVPHAAAHRIFGSSLFAATFGGAGFNRHLLHHMEPQISYTRLREVEQFLASSSRAAWLDEHRTTYGRAFAQLFRQAKTREPYEPTPATRSQ